jgi:hypothetical protein
MFLKGCQSLLGFTNNLRFVVVCDILGSQKFCKYLKRVAVQKSLRTAGLDHSDQSHSSYTDLAVKT